MERVLYNFETDEFRVVDEWYLLNLRNLSDDPSGDPEFSEELEWLEEQGWSEASSLQVARYLGEVYDEASLAAWMGKGTDAVATSSESPEATSLAAWKEKGADAAAMSSESSEATFDSVSMVLVELKRIAASNERVAESVETVAKHAHLLSPPMTVKQVAELTGVRSEKTVYRWHAEGLLAAMADNVRPLLFDRAIVHEFMEKRRRGRS